MAMTMYVNIVSAEEEIFSDVAEMLFAPAEMGELGIMPRHAALLTRLVPGEVRIKLPGSAAKEQSYFVSGGILEVQPHIVSILADTAVRAADLDEARAQEAKKRAEEGLQSQQDNIDYATVKAELIEAIAKLKMIEKLRKLKKL